MWPGKALEKTPRGVIPPVCVKYRRTSQEKNAFRLLLDPRQAVVGGVSNSFVVYWLLVVEPAEPSVPRPSSEGRTWAQVATGVANKTKLNNRYARTIDSSLLR